MSSIDKHRIRNKDFGTVNLDFDTVTHDVFGSVVDKHRSGNKGFGTVEHEDVLGVDASSFIPLLGMVGGMFGGGGGAKTTDPSAQMMQMQMMQAERDRQDRVAKDKAASERNQMIFMGVLGLVGVGATIYLLKK